VQVKQRERVPYLSALEVCSRQGAIQIHVYLYLYPEVVGGKMMGLGSTPEAEPLVGARKAKPPKDKYFCIPGNQFCQPMNVPNMRISQSACHVQMHPVIRLSPLAQVWTIAHSLLLDRVCVTTYLSIYVTLNLLSWSSAGY